jgi:hypothetical protein
VSLALGLAEKALEDGEGIFTAEAMEIEMALHREIAAFETGEVPLAFMRRSAFHSFPGREGVDLAAAGDEIGERGEGIGLVPAALGKLDGRGKAQGLRAPAQGPDALHFSHERFFVREVWWETGWGRLPRRGRERVSIQEVPQDLERPMARPRRLGHDRHFATGGSGNQRSSIGRI